LQPSSPPPGGNSAGLRGLSAGAGRSLEDQKPAPGAASRLPGLPGSHPGRPVRRVPPGLGVGPGLAAGRAGPVSAPVRGNSICRVWARAHSDRLFHRNRIPALETFRTLLCRLDLSVLLANGRKCRPEGIAGQQAGLCHKLGLVLGQVVAEGQDKTQAAIMLLEQRPLAARGQGLLT